MNQETIGVLTMPQSVMIDVVDDRRKAMADGHPVTAGAGECEDIRRRFREDDPSALARLYDLLAGKIFGMAVISLRSKAEAEDIVHDVFALVARNKEVVGRADNIFSYVVRMARNLVMDRIRGAGAGRRAEAAFADLLQAREEVKEIDPADLERLGAALEFLPAEQREVLTLKVFNGMTFEEIAELTEVSINTAAGRYRYAVEKLAKLLKNKLGHADDE